jgi:GNAT superfamily N-acetyltransferase
MSDIEIRHASAADFPALADLMTELGYPTSIEEISVRMAAIRDRKDFATFVAEADGEVAGMICVSVTPALYRDGLGGAIVALVVSSAFRGRGVAPLLVERGERCLLDSGADRATVNPSIARADAHRLYSRLGYAHSGLRFTKALGRAS